MTARAGSVSSRIRYRCQAGESSSHYASRRLIKYITSLPKKETDLTKSQVAVEALMLVWRMPPYGRKPSRAWATRMPTRRTIRNAIIASDIGLSTQWPK
jgi:hypothetical protein